MIADPPQNMRLEIDLVDVNIHKWLSKKDRGFVCESSRIDSAQFGFNADYATHCVPYENRLNRCTDFW